MPSVRNPLPPTLPKVVKICASTARIMSSQSKVPQRRAGKTVKRAEEQPATSEGSGEEVSSAKDSDEVPEQETQHEENLSQVPMSTFDASPSTREIVDNILPEELNVKMVERYMDGDLKLVHVLNLRWDRTQSWGQIRRLNKDLVERYVRSLQNEELRQHIRVLLRDLGTGV